MRVTRSVNNGTLILATGRGHHIHHDDPQLVTSAIRRIVALARTSAFAARPTR